MGHELDAGDTGDHDSCATSDRKGQQPTSGEPVLHLPCRSGDGGVGGHLSAPVFPAGQPLAPTSTSRLNASTTRLG